jgi:hypothetical protein
VTLRVTPARGSSHRCTINRRPRSTGKGQSERRSPPSIAGLLVLTLGSTLVYIAKVRYLYGNDEADRLLRYKRACPINIYTNAELIELIYKYKDLSEEP